MRQRLNAKKTAAIAKQTGLDVLAVVVRGGTDHRRDLWLRDGTIAHLWPDGTVVRTEYRHAEGPRPKG